MTYRVSLTQEAQDDLLRLYDFLIERELMQGGDLALVERALAAIQHGLTFLSHTPFSCRKADQSPFLRELVIPFGSSGYVALFEITSAKHVLIAAVRHQRESDYH